jgi:hypothetical protein
MGNWLESEEKTKNDHDRLVQDLQNVILKKFYTLCKRVNDVRPSSLDTSFKYQIIGNKSIIKYSHTDSDYPHELIGVLIKRGVIFDVLNQNEFIIDLFTTEYSFKGNQASRYHKSDNENGFVPIINIVCRKKANRIELLNWEDDNILKLIDWLLIDLNSIKNDLPGIEMESEATILTTSLADDLKKLEIELKNEEDLLIEIEKWHFGRSADDKEEEIRSQKGVINDILRKITDVNFHLKERFLKV